MTILQAYTPTTSTGFVFNVQDPQFAGGAKGDGTTDDTAAIQAAINAALALTGNRYGATVYFPPSFSSYRYSQLSIIHARECQITLRGDGNAMLRPITTSDSLGPSIIIKPATTPTTIGVDYLRHVRFERLYISGNGNVYGDSRTTPGDTDPYSAVRKRIGIYVEATQNFSMYDCYISHFRVGMRTRDMFDSELQNVQFLHCGYSAGDTRTESETDAFTTGYGYALELDRLLDQSNANKFLNLHFEAGPLFVLFRNNSRQNNFTGCKFENNIETADDVSTRSAIWFDGAIENQFVNCMFTEDATRGKYYVRGDFTDGTYNTVTNVRQAAQFSNCVFFANSTSKGLWWRGSHGRFTNCQFNRSDGAASLYPFLLSSHCVLTGCRITFADVGINCIRISSTYNQVHNNTLHTTTGTATGAVYFIEAGAANSYITDNEIAGAVTGVTVISATNSYLGSVVCHRRSVPGKTVTTGTTPSAFLSDYLTLTYASATSITNFLHGHDGKRITLRATNGNATLVHGASTIALVAAVNKTLTSGEVMELINDGGVWREL